MHNSVLDIYHSYAQTVFYCITIVIYAPQKKRGRGGGSQSTVAGTYFKSRWWEAIVLHLCETLGRHHQALSDRRCGCLAVAVVTQWLLVDAITHQVVYPGLQLHFHSATETIVCSLSSNRIKAGG